MNKLADINFNKLFRYIVSGAAGASVTLSLLFLFTDIFNVWYVYSSMIAYTCAFFVSFTLHKYWTFQNRNLHDIHIQFGTFLITFLINLTMNSFFIYSFVEFLKLNYLISQIFSAIIIAVASFFIYKHIVFINRPKSI